MRFDFDEIIDRKHTNSLKYDFAAERGKPADVLPLWVADMDFRTPPEVTKALVKCAEHSIFGYTEVKDDYFEAVKNWFLQGFDYAIKREWLVKTPGIVYAVCMAIRAFTEEGGSVLIQQPVYYPFASSIKANGRNVVNNPLVYENGAYRIDFVDFERKIVQNGVKLFILCSPHNPVGRVWTKDELDRMGSICLKHNVLVVSDEIHCDFVYDGHRHYVFSSLSGELEQQSVICTAPSKTFNLAGLQISNIFIANADLRRKFKHEITKTGYSQHNTMGLAACQSAYENGKEWVSGLNAYLAENINFIRKFIEERLPYIKMVETQGTYLAWLDCSALSMSEQALDDIITNRAKLWVDNGTMFGEEGEGFIRINAACPRETLKAALLRLESALRGDN